MLKKAAIVLSVFLTACPEAPSNLEGGGGAGGEAPPMNQNGAGGGGDFGTAGNAEFDAPPALDQVIDEPKHSQEELAATEGSVTLSGTIICESGTGPYRVRVFVPPPSEGGPEAANEGAPPGPLAAVSVPTAGEFSMLTPPGDALKVLAYEDRDDNGVPTPEETQFGTVDGGLTVLSADASVVLNCDNAAPAPDPIPVNTDRTPDGAMAPNSAEGAAPMGMPSGDGAAPPEGGAPPEGEMLPPDGAVGPAPEGLPPAEGQEPPAAH